MFKKLFIVVLVVGLSVSMVAMVATACSSHNTVTERVSWGIGSWLGISIANSHTDLGTFSCVDSADILHKNRLFVTGNVDWAVSATVGGTPINGHCPNYYLSVSLNPRQGSPTSISCGRRAIIWVDYHLRHLQCLVGGNYIAVVTYTATTR